jgi:hypothetical protein
MSEIMRVNIETIAPNDALTMLKMNTANFRKPDHHRINAYSNEMKAGSWVNNGDSIKFQGDELIDGQHRLMAIVKSGVTIVTVVVRDVEGVDAPRTIDRGKPRTVAQWCNYKGIKYGSVVSSSTKLIIQHEKGLWGRGNGMKPEEVTDSEIFKFIETNNTHLQQCCVMARRVRNIIPQSTMAAVLFIGCSRKDPYQDDLAKWFCEALENGEGMDHEDSVLHLRNRILSATPAKPISTNMKRMLLTMAWNKAVAGEPCSNASLRIRMTGPSKQPMPNEVRTTE